jgi:hypothetical protein
LRNDVGCAKTPRKTEGFPFWDEKRMGRTEPLDEQMGRFKTLLGSLNPYAFIRTATKLMGSAGEPKAGELTESLPCRYASFYSDG